MTAAERLALERLDSALRALKGARTQLEDAHKLGLPLHFLALDSALELGGIYSFLSRRLRETRQRALNKSGSKARAA